MKLISNFQKGLLISVVVMFLIAYPFFTISYFQTDKLISFYLTFICIPITFVLLFIIYRNKKIFFLNLNNLIQKSVLLLIFILFSNLIISLLFVSIATIVNCNIGSSEEIYINSKILKTNSSYTKNGKKRHYISFYNEKAGYVEDLEVYDKYQKGDNFNKKMKIGSLGLLYSK
jgi:hypothetical protein